VANPIVPNPFNKNHGLTATRTTQVVDVFFQSVNAFNNQDWGTYLSLLDPNVIIYNVDRVDYIIGIDMIRQYVYGITDPETFYPTSQFTLFPAVYPLSVRGVALWTHTAHGHVNAPIRYEVQFAPHDARITSVWATHSH
jgi:hypothetical protein